MTVSDFYDALADDYHRIYADWDAALERQGEALDRVVGSALGPGPKDILDASCGIGTQALALAMRGHRVSASDISDRELARLRREADARGVPLVRVALADLRSLSAAHDERFDVALSADNALPHLLGDDELAAAASELHAVLRPGGLLVLSTRDYDAVAPAPGEITSTPVRALGEGDTRRRVFQTWTWDARGETYEVEQFILTPAGAGWRTLSARTRYRALRRAPISAALRAAGFADVRWAMPEETGFYQPVATARRPR